MATKKSRRDVIKKAIYATPLILTLRAKPAKAQNGSQRPEPV